MRRRVVVGLALAALLVAHDAAAEVPPAEPCQAEACHFAAPIYVETQGGTILKLPPGYYLPDPLYPTLDAEVRRLQDAETRLAAENASLRASASSGAPWWAIGLGVAVGAVAGVYAYERWVD